MREIFVMIDPKTSLAYDALALQGIQQNQATPIINSAKKLFNLIPNAFNDKTSNVGLIVGKVQSGKTSVMIASAAMAFENGHRAVIALLSATELLLTQNYERFKSTFNKIGNNSIKVYQVSKDGDFGAIKKEELSYLYKHGKQILICVLKHKIRINSVTEQLSGTGYLEDCTLVFDDEGDDVSQNTASPKKKFGFDDNNNFIEQNFSATNLAIKNFKEHFKRVSYVSVTATPESIILLQNIQHLSPDFVLTTPPGIGYCGLSYFHSEHRDDLIHIMDEESADINETRKIPSTLKEALAHFVAGCFIRSIREGNSDFKHSMMIHSSRLIINHSNVTKKIESYLKTIKDSTLTKGNYATKFLSLVQEHINSIEPQSINFSYDELFEILDSLKITCMNGTTGFNNISSLQEVLPYHIFIGGDLLDRGVTISGLAVVYIVRESNIGQMDTLLQRARWFGYKHKYIDTCKIYMTAKLDEQFREMVPVDNAIWDMLCECSDNFIAPKDYEFELDMNSNILKPTSKAKASYENVLVGLRVAQKHIMLNKNYESQNKTLINLWRACHKDIIFDKKYGHQTHKLMTVSLKDTLQMLEKYHFPQEDANFNLIRFKSVINYLHYKENDDVDILFIQRPEGKERRSTINESNEITGLLQGHSTNKLPEDPDYYPGDRYIVGDNPMIQIHEVILKNDVKTTNDGCIKIPKGESVIMISWLFPTSAFSKMVIKKKKLPE